MIGRALISGTTSGLGRYLLNRYPGAMACNRDVNWGELEKSGHFDTIIHCAADARFKLKRSEIQSYYQSNVGLTDKLLRLSSTRFVFISTADVYPSAEGSRHESEEFEISSPASIYGFLKLCSEALVQAQANKWLILRPTALLGPGMRKNSLVRVLTEKNPQLTLAPDSTFNYVLYDDVAGVIEAAAQTDVGGIFNLASARPIKISEVVPKDSLVQFGGYKYQCPDLANEKVTELWPALKRTSLETIDIFRTRDLKV